MRPLYTVYTVSMRSRDGLSERFHALKVAMNSKVFDTLAAGRLDANGSDGWQVEIAMRADAGLRAGMGALHAE